MRMKRTTGLVLSLALLMIPATAALAKPVVSHHVDVVWSESVDGVTVNGGFDLTVDEAGITVVDFLTTELRMETCADGSTGLWRSSLQFSGETGLQTVIDRQLKSIAVRGTLQVERTVTSSCEGVSVTNELLDVSLNGVSVDRPVRTRDRVNGTRIISSAQQIALSLGGVSNDSFGTLTKSIWQA